jgi:hypothetical protein
MTNTCWSRSIVPALASSIAITALVAAWIESFNPTQLLRLNDGATGKSIVALDRQVEAVHERARAARADLTGTDRWNI